MTRNGPRWIGAMILGGGTLLVLGCLAWLQAAHADGEIGRQGFALGLLLCLALVLPVMSGGIWLLVRGRVDLAGYRRAVQARRLQRLLAEGEARRLGELLLQLETDRDGLREVAELAAREGLAGGHVDWRGGWVHPAGLAPGLQRCPACGGTVEVGGRGAHDCPYCQALLIVGSGRGGEPGIRGLAPPG